MAKIVMYWDCEYSPNEKIPGYVRECPGCGHPRSRNVRFYHSNPPHQATPAEIVLMGKPDPNWYCMSCLCGNLQSDDKCWKCGSPRTADAPVHVVHDYHSKDLAFSTKEAVEKEAVQGIVTQKKWVPAEDPYNPQSNSTPVQSPAPIFTAPSNYNFRKEVETVLDDGGIEERNANIKMGLIAAGGVAGIFGIIWLVVMAYNFFFTTHVENVSVTSMPWTQLVRIEDYKTYSEEGWHVPGEVLGQYSAGRQTDCQQRKSGEITIHDGWHSENVPDTCYKSEQVPDTCTGYHDVPDTCTGYHNVPDICYQDDGNGGSESYSCSTSESYTYSCTKSESYTYSCTKTEQVPYSCTKVVQVEDTHQQDVIEPYYWYDIERWKTLQTYTTSGNGPEVYYDPIQPQGDRQRRIEEGGSYSVTFGPEDPASKVTPFTNQYDLSVFQTFSIGQLFEVDVNYFGMTSNLR